MILLFIITKAIALEYDLFQATFTNLTQNDYSRTFIYKPFDDSKKYILFELYIKNNFISVSHLLITCSLNKLPQQQMEGSVDAMYQDLNAYYENSTYHHILTKPIDNYSQDDTYYITIFNPNMSVYMYTLNVTTNFNPICPNNCKNRGICNLGICDCKYSFLDLDCSKEGENLFQFHYSEFRLFFQHSYRYLYYQHSNKSSQKLVFFIKYEFDVEVYLMLEDFEFGVPNSQHYLLKNYFKLENISFTLNTSQIQYLAQLQRFQKVIITISSKQEQDIFISVHNDEGDGGDSDPDLRFKIVLGLGTAIAIIIVIIFKCIKCFPYFKDCTDSGTLSSNQTNKQELNLQKINQYLPKCKYAQVFETVQFKRKTQIKQLNEICKVCFLQFNDNMECIFTPCLHIFHSQCLEQWLIKHQNCPNCRVKITQEELVKHEVELKRYLEQNLQPIKLTTINNIQINEQDQQELIQFE